MGYKKFLEEQRKYMETKKEALLAKEERKKNPRPPRLDPPPQSGSMFITVALIFTIVIFLLPLMALFHVRSHPVEVISDEPMVYIFATQQEYSEIKGWLEPELLANNLKWNIERGNLGQSFPNTGTDLLLIDAELAEQFYTRQVLAPIFDKRISTDFEDFFYPLWEAEPFKKNLGWVIPYSGRVDEARHLITVIRQFAEPFNL